MIDLSLTDEQKAFRDALRKFAKNEIVPLVDRGKSRIPAIYLQKNGGTGISGCPIP